MKTKALGAKVLLLASVAGLASCATAFREHYRGNLGGRPLEESGLLPNPGEPQVIVGGSRIDDDVHMLESGYRMVGLVFFEGLDEGTEPIERLARELKVAVAYAYKRPSLVQPHRMHLHLSGDHVGPPRSAKARFYEQGATFWAKSSSPPAFGALVRPARDAEGNVEATGVAVAAVVRDSPASRCGIRRGDTILKVGGQAVESVATYVSILMRSGGQTVEVEVRRDGASTALTCPVGASPESFAGMPPE